MIAPIVSSGVVELEDVNNRRPHGQNLMNLMMV